MPHKKPIGLGVIIALVAMLAMAFSAASASATIVTPPNTAVTATNSGETRFIPENGYDELFVGCEESEAKTTTPTNAETNNNQNRISIGTFSRTAGSVTMDLTSSPTFKKCSLRAFTEPPEGEGSVAVAGAEVTTNSTNGSWTLVGLGNTQYEPEGIAAIGVPKEGATISVEGCPIVVSPTQSSVVTAKYFNETAAQLHVDGQIKFKDEFGCSPFNAANPAQYEGKYAVSNNLRIRQ